MTYGVGPYSSTYLADGAIKMQLPLVPYLRFLAQLRHVIVLLHELSGLSHELPEQWYGVPGYQGADFR